MWIACVLHLDYMWFAHGLHVDCIWITCRLSFFHIIALGLHLDFMVIASGLHVECIWIECGFMCIIYGLQLYLESIYIFIIYIYSHIACGSLLPWGISSQSQCYAIDYAIMRVRERKRVHYTLFHWIKYPLSIQQLSIYCV